jgi:hypothetical protein
VLAGVCKRPVSSQSGQEASSNVLGLTSPDFGGTTKLLRASVTNTLLIKKSSCPLPGSTSIVIISGIGIRYRANRRDNHASSALLAASLT